MLVLVCPLDVDSSTRAQVGVGKVIVARNDLMERRGCGLGCIIVVLGLMLGVCLLPYLISSLYSIVSSVLQVPTASTWLWGEWINTVVDSSNPIYMILAEGPICCVGTIALLILILGVVLVITSLGPAEEDYEVDRYEAAAEEDWDQEEPWPWDDGEQASWDQRSE
jgi:hypothetical protein